jgi:protease-4
MDTDTVLERRRLRRRASFWRVTAFIILAGALLAILALSSGMNLDGLEPRAARSQVARIDVDGFIDTRPDAVEVIEKAAEAPAVKAIVLRINSPGGAASGGEALYRAIRAASANKPVVAVIDGLGASGGYMTAIAADHVIARESAVTGSIGVIFQYGHFEDLLSKIGARYEEVKSAPLKGQPSPFTPPSPEAVQMLQALVDDSYDWFVGLVAERRNMPEAEARRLSDGSIYTGRQAFRLKLVDGLGDERDARAWLASKGISEDLPVQKWEKEESLFGWLTAQGPVAGLMRLAGFDASLVPAALLPRRLAVDGLLSVWHVPDSVRSDR